MIKGYKMHPEGHSPSVIAGNLALEHMGPIGSPNHFFASGGRNGQGVWYMVCQTGLAATDIDWTLMERHGAAPGSPGEGGGWIPTTITGAESSSTDPMLGLMSSISKKDTDRINIYWDEYTRSDGKVGGTLHVLLNHVHSGGTLGSRYVNFKMTPSSDADTADTWEVGHSDLVSTTTGTAVNYYAGGKFVVHDKFVDGLSKNDVGWGNDPNGNGDTDDATGFHSSNTDNFWPLSGYRMGLWLENNGDNRRVWVSFFNNNKVYFNCSAYEDKETGTWKSSWIKDNIQYNTSSGAFGTNGNALTDYITHNIDYGWSKDSSESNDDNTIDIGKSLQIQMRNVKEAGVEKFALLYTFNSGSSTFIMSAIKTPSTTPAAPTTHQFGTSAGVHQEADDFGEYTHHFATTQTSEDNTRIWAINVAASGRIRIMEWKYDAAAGAWAAGENGALSFVEGYNSKCGFPSIAYNEWDNKVYFTFQKSYNTDYDSNSKDRLFMYKYDPDTALIVPAGEGEGGEVPISAEADKPIRAMGSLPYHPLTYKSGIMVQATIQTNWQQTDHIDTEGNVANSGLPNNQIKWWSNVGFVGSYVRYLAFDYWWYWANTSGAGGDNSNVELSNIHVTSPDSGQTFSTGDTITISWEIS